jgi:heat shock protein HslJ/uncharacterized protein YraI
MNKRYIFIFMLLLGLVLAACGGAPAATPTPTDALPAASDGETAESPQAEPVPMTGTPLTADAAMGVTWQWTTLRQAGSPMPGVVPFSENYTITFMPDGTASIKADCNQVIAQYTLGTDGDLSIVLGPSTLVACPEGSSDAQYLNLLSKVVSGSLQDGGLMLATSDGEMMGFLPGEASDTTAGSTDMAAMQDIVWQWQTIDEAGVSTAVPNPENYTLVLQSDGLLSIQADCNQVGGGYGLTNEGIVLNLGASTRVACGPDSLDQRFLAELAAVESAEMLADSLVLTTNTGNKLEFANGGPFILDSGAVAPVATGPTAEEVNNILWQWVDLSEQGTLTAIENPVQYTAGFFYDGNVVLQSDCNRVLGTFTRDGRALSIVLGPSTMAACPEGSLDQQFNALMSDAVDVEVVDGRLLITTAAGAVLGFANGGPLPGTVALRPSQISIDPQGLPYAYQVRVAPMQAYDGSQPAAPTGLPEHIEIAFSALDTAAPAGSDPIMYIIPVGAYEAQWAANDNALVAQTIDYIASLSAALPNPAPTSGLPALPMERVSDRFNDVAAQVVQPTVNVDSASMKGFRLAGRWVQNPLPITNADMQYVYQGLTNDGQYMVSFFFPPLATPLLPNTEAELSTAEADAYAADALDQIATVTAQLNLTGPAEWTPDLNTLDALVASLRIEGMPANGLAEQTWLWTGRSSLGGEVVAVADPQNYTVTYNADGSLYFQADCNNGAGTYSAGGGFTDSVSHTLGAMTMVACPEGSRADEFTNGLAAAQTFRVAPGGTTMELLTPSGGEVLTFAREGSIEIDLTPPEPPEAGVPTGQVIASQGVNLRTGPGTAYASFGVAPFGATAPIAGRSQDGQWWVFNTASSPTGLGWVSASNVAASNAENVPVIAAPPLPTPVPTPTIAPTPAASLSFTADQTTINRGECTTLRWSVENIQAVWVYQQGNDWRNSPVTGQGSQQVCPEVTTTYQMRVQLTDGSVELRSITIVVNQPNTLINTHWMLSRLNMSSIPVSPSPLTLHFSGADSANGFDGCNNFNGPYFAAAGGIAIGPLAGGMMACEDDLMSQATIYRQALQSAQTFTNDGSTLVLFGPGGVEVARFSAIVATPFGG